MREGGQGGARLLVVDDNKGNRLLLARTLELQGHRVDSAENGRVALEKLRREEFDLVLINTYYLLMFSAISGHGGVVNPMLGDGLIAIFGAPLPLPDHRESAVCAELEMIELVDLYNLERAGAAKPPIRIGIGIASGDMAAGYTGTNERATYTCIGDTVNLASRIEAHTKLAQRAILIDGATRRGLGDRIEVEALGPVAFKGKTTPVDVFCVPVRQKP